MWYKSAKKWVADGKLVIIGITQEQHPERCRLFAQWHGIDWPILHDPINFTETGAVPVFTAIDEHGIVRLTRARVRTFERDFLDKTFDPPNGKASKPTMPQVPDFAALRKVAQSKKDAASWREYGDALLLWGERLEGEDSSWGTVRQATKAIAAYKESQKLTSDPRTLFRLGVAYRVRFDAKPSGLKDFDYAVDFWGKALGENPNQYIYRRRIQQYGPRLSKPYPFYDWVVKARKEIEARGDKPIQLRVEPRGAEIANPTRRFVADESGKEPDPDGKINRDTKELVRTHVSLVPANPKPGSAVRVHLTLAPGSKAAYWNNEAEPLKVWLPAADGVEVDKRFLTADAPKEAESKETRKLEFDARIPRDASGEITIKAYALYYVCEHEGGACYYLRKDIPIKIPLP